MYVVYLKCYKDPKVFTSWSSFTNVSLLQEYTFVCVVLSIAGLESNEGLHWASAVFAFDSLTLFRWKKSNAHGDKQLLYILFILQVYLWS